MALAPGSYWLRRTGLDSFFFRNSSGSIPIASASSSIADSMPKAPCEWPGARSGACGPAFVKTSYSSGLKFGLLWYMAEAGPAVPAPVAAPGRAVGLVVDSGERAVLLRAQLDGDEGARRVARAQLLLLAVQHQLDGRAGLLRQLAGDHRERAARRRGAELAAEAAAHVLADDAHVLAVDAEGLGETLADREDPLRRGVAP